MKPVKPYRDALFRAPITGPWEIIKSAIKPANVYKGDQIMKDNIFNSAMMIFVTILILTLAVILMLGSKAVAQDMRSGSYTDGYGSYDTMGQDPEAILNYGRDMMRYGFRESGMSGGSSKYPGYNRYLNNETIKKLNDEQEAFIKSTQDLRQAIYEKELYLKAELVKKNPDTAIALGFQKNISDARGAFEQKMIEHLIRMKKINSVADEK